MVNDKDLRNARDYTQGQKEAAYAVLGEIANLMRPFADDVRIIGGWVPTLLFPEMDHIGSIDVDVLINQQNIKRKDQYATIKELLAQNGYHRHSNPHKYFSYVKTFIIDEIPYEVEVDFLSGKYGGEDGSASKHVNGIKALPATGGNFAFEFKAEDVKIDYRRPDGALDSGHVKVVSVVPYLVMKTEAMGRGKPKDAYDIYFCLVSWPDGINALVDMFVPYKEHKLIQNMAIKLHEKFMSPDHAGPTDIVGFMDLSDEEEIDRIRQDAYQRVKLLIDTIGIVDSISS